MHQSSTRSTQLRLGYGVPQDVREMFDRLEPRVIGGLKLLHLHLAVCMRFIDLCAERRDAQARAALHAGGHATARRQRILPMVGTPIEKSP